LNKNKKKSNLLLSKHQNDFFRKINYFDWIAFQISSRSISSKFFTVLHVPYCSNVSFFAAVNIPIHLIPAATAARTPDVESSKTIQECLSTFKRRANSK